MKREYLQDQKEFEKSQLIVLVHFAIWLLYWFINLGINRDKKSILNIVGLLIVLVVQFATFYFSGLTSSK